LVPTSIAAVLLSITFSAEFDWEPVFEDDPRAFFGKWAIDWVPSLAAFAAVLAVLQQVRVIRRGQRTEYAPVLRLGLDIMGTPARPLARVAEDYYADPFEDDELDGHRKADGEDGEDSYLELTIVNLQKHPAGAAGDVEVQFELWLPKGETFVFAFPLGHIQPGAVETHVIVKLTGLILSAIEIVSIEFYDASGDRHTKAHGLAVLEYKVPGGAIRPFWEPGNITIG
jgi:hypothetical protein